MEVHQQHLDAMTRQQGMPVRDIVLDLDAEETQCPACLTTFATAGVTRRPDCGLNFGG